MDAGDTIVEELGIHDGVVMRSYAEKDTILGIVVGLYIIDGAVIRRAVKVDSHSNRRRQEWWIVIIFSIYFDGINDQIMLIASGKHTCQRAG
jgi:hypothetical protein